MQPSSSAQLCNKYPILIMTYSFISFTDVLGIPILRQALGREKNPIPALLVIIR